MRRLLFSWYELVRTNVWLVTSLTGAAVLVSTFASWGVVEAQNRERERSFQEVSDTVYDRLEMTVGGWISLGESGRDLVQLSDGISGEHFWEFSQHLTESYPVIKAQLSSEACEDSPGTRPSRVATRPPSARGYRGDRLRATAIQAAPRCIERRSRRSRAGGEGREGRSLRPPRERGRRRMPPGSSIRRRAGTPRRSSWLPSRESS